MSRDVMLTTIDNPYDPFDQFSEWFAYDTSKGYDTCGLVARLTFTSSEFSEELQTKDIEEAIDEFLLIDPVGLYQKKVKN